MGTDHKPNLHTEICVNNGDSVEFGQVLMYVE